MNLSLENRKIEERDFHNKREHDRSVLTEKEFLDRYHNKKAYIITGNSRDYFSALMKKHCSGGKVLDYCCGLGGVSVRAAKFGAYVYGIDISEESVSTAKKQLAEIGLGDKGTFQVMDAENMTFPDKMFDVIICSGVLYHLDIDKALSELARVLKPSGVVICGEALGYNPLINLYRRRTRHLRTAWEIDHILTLREVKKARRYFNKVDIKFFHLFSIIGIPFQSTVFFRPLLAFLNAVDFIALKIPLVQLLAWQMIFVLSKPKSVSKGDDS